MENAYKKMLDYNGFNYPVYYYDNCEDVYNIINDITDLHDGKGEYYGDADPKRAEELANDVLGAIDSLNNYCYKQVCDYIKENPDTPIEEYADKRLFSKHIGLVWYDGIGCFDIYVILPFTDENNNDKILVYTEGTNGDGFICDDDDESTLIDIAYNNSNYEYYKTDAESDADSIKDNIEDLFNQYNELDD